MNTTRRSFFRSIGIATAALYLRIAPDLAARVPDNARETELPDGEYEVCFILCTGGFERMAPEKWDGSKFERIPSMPTHPFVVRNGFIEWE